MGSSTMYANEAYSPNFYNIGSVCSATTNSSDNESDSDNCSPHKLNTEGAEVLDDRKTLISLLRFPTTIQPFKLSWLTTSKLFLVSFTKNPYKTYWLILCICDTMQNSKKKSL